MEQSKEIEFKNLGWVSKVQKRKLTYFLSISKVIAVGSVLDNGQRLYSYLSKDNQGRDIIIIYLDGNPRDKDKKTKIINYNLFLEE